MALNPYAGTNSEQPWGMGFSWGFFSPDSSTKPPLVINPDDVNVFNEGTYAGQLAAVNGIVFDPVCFSLANTAPEGPEEAMSWFHWFELIDIAVDIVQFKKHAAHLGVALAVTAFIMMIPSGPPDSSPEHVFANMSYGVRQLLVSLGLDNGALYFGAGIDESQKGCELLATAVFPTADAARAAVKSQSRSQYFLAEWNANNSSSFSVIEAGRQ
jgi:hypothetical protein